MKRKKTLEEATGDARAWLKTQPRKRLFVVDAGDSTTGPIGFVAEIEAYDRQDALNKVAEALADAFGDGPVLLEVDVPGLVVAPRVYFGPHNLTIDQVHEA